MSKYVEYTMDIGDSQNIALSQSGKTVNQPLNLNGKYQGTLFNKTGFSAFVTITLSQIQSGVNFTIYGGQNRSVLSEVVTSTNNSTTIISTQPFDMVASITADTDLTNLTISAGTVFGYTNAITYSVPMILGVYGGLGITNSLFTVNEKTGNNNPFYCTYNLYGALMNIATINKTISQMINNKDLYPIDSFTTDKSLLNVAQPFYCCVLEIIFNNDTFPNTILRGSQVS